MTKIRAWCLAAGAVVSFVSGVVVLAGYVVVDHGLDPDQLMWDYGGAIPTPHNPGAVAFSMAFAVVVTAAICAVLGGVIGVGVGTTIEHNRRRRRTPTPNPPTHSPHREPDHTDPTTNPAPAPRPHPPGETGDGRPGENVAADGAVDRQRRAGLRRARRRQAVILAATVVVAYVAAFPGNLVLAVDYAGDNGLVWDQAQVAEWGGWEEAMTAWSLLLFIGVAVMMVGCPGWWFSVRNWPWVQRTAPVAAMVGSLAVIVCGIVGSDVLSGLLREWDLINTFTDAAYENAPSDWVHSISTTVAHVLLTVAIPATVLRYYRVPTMLALPILVAARLIPYLYLGYIGVWSLLPWALATAAVYWRWPSLTLLAALILIDIAPRDLGVYGTAVLIGVALLALTIAFAIDRRWYRHRTPVTPTISPRTLLPRR
ncbi:hypothetical protein ACLTEW_23965 [Gordonia lacunae]|uniref:hypothetical protein n=1 Tax=Gordonia lacunae TaxID=417102 RepID=UPI0039E34A77